MVENEQSNKFSEITLLSISLVVSALIISASVFLAGGEIGSKINGLATLVASMPADTGGNEDTINEINTIPSGGAGEADDGENQGNDSTTAGLMANGPSKGSDDAPVVIVDFSDFQCPFCARFYSQTLPQLEENYIETGKVQFVYRDYPLGFHAQAKPAAMAAECANEQGKFWEFHDMIYENQSEMGAAAYAEWAEDIGLDTAKFSSCIDSQKYSSEVDNDFSAGSAAGVSGTPTFFVGKRNGTPQKIVGAQPYSTFQTAIDSLLG